VARGVDDVDFRVFIADSGVFREDCDTALALDIAAIHHAFADGLVLAKSARLFQKFVHHRSLAVIDVGYDGDISYLFQIFLRFLK